MQGDPLVDWSEWASWLAWVRLGVRPPKSSSKSKPEIRLPESFRRLNDHVYEVCEPPAGERPSVEIAFFHGLQLECLSEPYITTWLSRDKTALWLMWLPEKLPNARILTVSYDASRERTHTQGRSDMYVICENLITCLTDSRAALGENECPIILVGHCFGGLVIKEILIKAADSMRNRDIHKERIEKFLTGVKAIFFYATPHHGTQLANVNRGFQKGPLFEIATPLNSDTERRNEAFREIRQRHGWKSAGVGEGQTVKVENFTGLIVEEGSARCDCDQYYTIINADHFDVCRPESIACGSFHRLLDLITEVLEQVASAPAVKRRGLELLPFQKDSRGSYVQLESEGKSIHALSKTGRDSPNVVLLHGGPGIGKSTVARQVCLKHAEHNSTSTVIMLECGPGADVQAKQMELIHHLECYKFNLSEIVGLPYGGTLQTRLQLCLQNLPKDQTLLIFLDDVWEPRFLQDFVNLSGQGVKYLVTSRQNIFRGVNCKLESIQMEKLGLDDSKKILAIHAGFASQHIPDHLQEVAEKILNQSVGIPLILATLGAQIAQGNRDSPEMWRSVSEYYVDCLSETPELYIHGREYTMSYWSALEQSINSLSVEQKNLLALIGTCKGPSVPQNLLQFFYNNGFPNDTCNEVPDFRFQQMTTKLKSRELMFEMNDKQLSLHSLTKEFLIERMGKAMHSILPKDLFGKLDAPFEPNVPKTSADKTRVIVVLARLYLDARFSERVALQIDHSSDTFSDARRTAIEPITLLLVHEINREKIKTRKWSGELQMSAIQVLLKFICNNALDTEHVSQLLECTCPAWVTSTLTFLQNVSMLNESFWQEETIQTITSSLLKLFQENVDPYSQFQAGKTLLHVSIEPKCGRAGNVSSAVLLQKLVDSLSQGQALELQSGAACALAGIAMLAGHESVLEIVNFQGLLPALVEALTSSSSLNLPRFAACAINNLMNAARIMIDFPMQHDDGIMVSQKSPQKSYPPSRGVTMFGRNFHELAPLPPQNYVATVGTDILHTIISCPNLIESFASLVARDDNPLLQELATGSLGTLASTDQEITKKLVNYPRLLEDLVRLLQKHQRPKLLVAVAFALRFFVAYEEDIAIVSKVAGCPNLLESLVASFTHDANPDFQDNAFAALASLVGKDQAIQEKIVNFPGLLDDLVRVLQKNENSDVSTNAALILRRLSTSTATVIVNKIAHHPKLLETLSASLATNNNLYLQTNAVAALTGLAYKHEKIAEKIVDLHGLLNHLVKLLRADEKPDLSSWVLGVELSSWAAAALFGLVDSNNTEIAHKIADCPNLLESLATSLAKDNNLLLQGHTAAVLANLGWKVKAIRKKIMDLPGLLNLLVKSLQDRRTPEFLPMNAAFALRSLAESKDNSIVCMVASCPNLIESLAVPLANDHNLCLQENAIALLVSLGGRTQANIEKIVNDSGLLNSLVESLKEHRSSKLATKVAFVLQSLAASEDRVIVYKIGKCTNLIESLAAALARHDNLLLQQNAAAALGNLEGKDQGFAEKIVNLPGVLDNLAKFIQEHQNLNLPANAAGALGQLAISANTVTAWKIVGCPSLLESLVASLEKDENPCLQANAAELFGSLGGKDPRITEIIVNDHGLLEHLANLLQEHQSSYVSAYAALALGRLAASKDIVILHKFAGCPHLLEGLAGALTRDDNLFLQENATIALANLGGKEQAINEKIKNLPGLLDHLDKWAQEHQSLNVQHEAARAVTNLMASSILC